MSDATGGAPVPAGWYADPWFTGQRRYWTGSTWTSDVFADAVSPTGARVEVMSRGTYGAPPTTPSPVPPPPPEWGSAAPELPPPFLPPVPRPAVPVTTERPFPVVALLVAGAIALLVTAFALWPMRSQDSTTAAPTPTPTASPAAPTPSPTAPSPNPASPSPSPTGGTASPAPAVDPELANLVVRQQDVPTGKYIVGQISGGSSVAPEDVTLDLCSGTYPSEKLRKARLQVAAVDLAGKTTLSTEAVRYASEAATAQAFDEVRAAAQACANGKTSTAGGVTTTTTVTPNADGTWPRTAGVDRLAYTVKSTDTSTGEVNTTVVVYLRRGPLFIGVYFPQPSGAQMPVEGKTTIPTIVKVFEDRLLHPPTTAPSPVPTLGGSSGGSTSGGGVSA